MTKRRLGILAAGLSVTLCAGIAPAVGVGTATAGAAAPRGLSWTKCSAKGLGKFQCATLTVPMSYSSPGGRTVQIAVARAKATGPSEGTLIFNPGGPGEAGLPLLPQIAENLPPQIRQHFDVVAFDPRGVGASRPKLMCPAPKEDGSGSQVSFTDALSYYTSQVKAQSGALASCAKDNAPFIDSVGTITVARDLDRLREGLGVDKINYWGISYGTRIGAVYAQLFPTHLRTLILDGNVPPNTDLLGFLTGAVTGRDQALSFFQSQYPQAAAAFGALTQKLANGPVKLKNGNELTMNDVVELVTGQLSSEVSYPKLAEQLTETAREAGLQTSSSQGTGPLPLPSNEGAQQVQTAESGSGDAVLRAVNCIDLPGRPTPQQMAQAAAQAEPSAPIFGGIDLGLLPLCSGFPVRQDPIPTIHPQGAPGALVVNSQYDPATPLAWAQQMANAIPGSKMVVYQGSQHGVTWMVHSSCVDNAANAYLLSGNLPATNLTCPVVKPSA